MLVTSAVMNTCNTHERGLLFDNKKFKKAYIVEIISIESVRFTFLLEWTVCDQVDSWSFE